MKVPSCNATLIHPSSCEENFLQYINFAVLRTYTNFFNVPGFAIIASIIVQNPLSPIGFLDKLWTMDGGNLHPVWMTNVCREELTQSDPMWYYAQQHQQSPDKLWVPVDYNQIYGKKIVLELCIRYHIQCLPMWKQINIFSLFLIDSHWSEFLSFQCTVKHKAFNLFSQVHVP